MSEKVQEAVLRHHERVSRAIETAANNATRLSLSLLELELGEELYGEALAIIDAMNSDELVKLVPADDAVLAPADGEQKGAN